MKNVLAIETRENEFYGNSQEIGCIVLDENCNKIDSFFGDYKRESNARGATHKEYIYLLIDFSKFYLKYMQNADIIMHNITAYKIHVFSNILSYDLISQKEMPYPLIDISGNLQQAGYDPTNIHLYNSKNNIKCSNDFTDNSLTYCRAMAVCYFDLRKKIPTI